MNIPGGKNGTGHEKGGSEEPPNRKRIVEASVPPNEASRAFRVAFRVALGIVQSYFTETPTVFLSTASAATTSTMPTPRQITAFCTKPATMKHTNEITATVIT